MTNAVVEHRSSPLGRRARRNRVWIALAIAAGEGLLVLLGAISWWVVALAAVAAVGLYVLRLRDHGNADVRTASWIAAVSQLLVVLVPVVAGLALALALVVVVLLAVGMLAALLLDRR
ncbi:MAG: hypothetical protein ACRC50_13895 [Gaiella sp.]